MGTLNGKVAIVTGASRGIGRGIAERLAQEGASIVVNYVADEQAASAVVETVRATGAEAHAIRADIADLGAVRRLFDSAMQRYGRLDILVANAGYCAFAPLAQTTDEAFDRLFAVNARGTFYCLREGLKHIADGGRIVCVSTIGTVHNLPGGACYFASKAAVEQFCGVLAREVASRGITVNTVSPGFVDTEMFHGLLADTPSDTPQKLLDQTPLARFGTPGDIAETVAFLAGPGAAWVTRQNLAVDGGIISR